MVEAWCSPPYVVVCLEFLEGRDSARERWRKRVRTHTVMYTGMGTDTDTDTHAGTGTLEGTGPGTGTDTGTDTDADETTDRDTHICYTRHSHVGKQILTWLQTVRQSAAPTVPPPVSFWPRVAPALQQSWRRFVGVRLFFDVQSFVHAYMYIYWDWMRRDESTN